MEKVMNSRYDVIQTLISANLYKSYLEIGCEKNATFDRIRNVERKVGVDPNEGGTVRMTSDEYFASCDEMFDVIFIDGLHHHDQVTRDVENAFFTLDTEWCNRAARLQSM